MATIPPTALSKQQRLSGWALSAGLVYVTQALAWAGVWSFLILGPDNQASTHWAIKMVGGFFLGLAIGLIPAGAIFLAAYSVPGAIVWATARESSVWWMRRPAAACGVGAFLGIAVVGTLVSIDQLSNALEQWPFVIVLGSLYGTASAVACLVVAHKIVRTSKPSS